MMKTILIAVAALSIAGCAHVESTIIPEELAKRYVEVVNAKNEAAMRDLIHPDCLADLSPVQELFMSDMLTRMFRHLIPQEHSVSISMLESEVEPFSDMVDWKVRPTHQVQISFSKGEHSSVAIILFIRETREGWRVVLPLPNDENLEKYKEKLESQQESGHVRK